MILGIGIDVVENARIADAIRRHGDHFVQKIYQAARSGILPGDEGSRASFCGRVCRQGSGIEAFGTGFVGQFSWKDIEVRRKASGEPFIVLHARGGRNWRNV